MRRLNRLENAAFGLVVFGGGALMILLVSILSWWCVARATSRACRGRDNHVVRTTSGANVAAA